MKYLPEHFMNRDLSWLEFNDRVLEEAVIDKNPLFERLNFLAITSSNMDEFFMVRVAGLKAQIESDFAKQGIAGLFPKEQMDKIIKRVKKITEKQYSCFNELIKDKLTKEKFFFKKYNELTNKQKSFADNYFEEILFPILTPMAIDSSRPFPHLLNKSLNIMAKLTIENEDHFSIVQVPNIIGRFIELPEKDGRSFILTEELIKSNINLLFTGYNIEVTAEFRLTRDGEMIIDEDEADDLLIEIENSLKKRQWGTPVRLEIKKDIDQSILNFLKESLSLHNSNVYEVDGALDLTFLFAFTGLNNIDPSFKYKPQIPLPHPAFNNEDSIFSNIRKGDILFHHPYETFDYIVDLVEKAANDSKVLAIKQTLYRVSGNSPIVQSLIKAALKGKQVTVLVEIKARFDEERNIKWAKKLEDSGCHVIYGLKGLKTHSKCLLIVRKENNGIRRYAHFGTGNYNDSTAKLYTDMGLLTCKEEYCIDASNLFNKLTGFSNPKSWLKLAVAPEGLRERFETLIDKEIEYASKGKEAKIIAKVNSLVDYQIIEKLYDASCAGVKIQLIVRGACCLKPGVKGVSENIEVYSLIGRYLEHSRIFCFANNGKAKLYLSSADWMTRNLDRRVETLFPIEAEDNRDKILELIEFNLKDTFNLRIIKSDGSFEKVKCGKHPFDSHTEFYKITKKRSK